MRDADEYEVSPVEDPWLAPKTFRPADRYLVARAMNGPVVFVFSTRIGKVS